jgi:hypothetical protein
METNLKTSPESPTLRPVTGILDAVSDPRPLTSADLDSFHRTGPGDHATVDSLRALDRECDALCARFRNLTEWAKRTKQVAVWRETLAAFGDELLPYEEAATDL